jgi:hypothetical protein
MGKRATHKHDARTASGVHERTRTHTARTQDAPVNVLITNVPLGVPISVRLVGAGRVGAVVAGVANTVQIGVLLGKANAERQSGPVSNGHGSNARAPACSRLPPVSCWGCTGSCRWGWGWCHRQGRRHTRPRGHQGPCPSASRRAKGEANIQRDQSHQTRQARGRGCH